MPKLAGGQESLWEMSALVPGRGPGDSSTLPVVSQALSQSTVLRV